MPEHFLSQNIDESVSQVVTQKILLIGQVGLFLSGVSASLVIAPYMPLIASSSLVFFQLGTMVLWTAFVVRLLALGIVKDWSFVKTLGYGSGVFVLIRLPLKIGLALFKITEDNWVLVLCPLFLLLCVELTLIMSQFAPYPYQVLQLAHLPCVDPQIRHTLFHTGVFFRQFQAVLTYQLPVLPTHIIPSLFQVLQSQQGMVWEDKQNLIIQFRLRTKGIRLLYEHKPVKNLHNQMIAVDRIMTNLFRYILVSKPVTAEKNNGTEFNKNELS